MVVVVVGGPLVKTNSRGASEPEEHGGPGSGRHCPLTDTTVETHPAQHAPGAAQLSGKSPRPSLPPSPTLLQSHHPPLNIKPHIADIPVGGLCKVSVYTEVTVLYGALVLFNSDVTLPLYLSWKYITGLTS